MADKSHQVKRSWREVLPVHPAAELFPLMSETELRELGEDIKAHGLLSPFAITATKQPKGWSYSLLDGRNRLDAMELVGISFSPGLDKGTCVILTQPKKICLSPFVSVATVVPENEAYAYVISANAHRRHLTVEQKLEVIAKLVKAAPGKSDRQIADAVKASPTTVGKVRKELEATGDVSTVDTRTDTKGRKQQAHKREVFYGHPSNRLHSRVQPDDEPTLIALPRPDPDEPIARDTEAEETEESASKAWKRTTEEMNLAKDEVHDDLEQMTAEQRGGTTDEEWAALQQLKSDAAKQLLLSAIMERNKLRIEVTRLLLMLEDIKQRGLMVGERVP
jgi:ParB-like chromosome segregation protein Spo0J